MLKPRYVRRTYYASVQSDEALRILKDRYSLSTDSDCLRYALLRLAEAPPAPLPGAKKRRGETGC